MSSKATPKTSIAFLFLCIQLPILTLIYIFIFRTLVSKKTFFLVLLSLSIILIVFSLFNWKMSNKKHFVAGYLAIATAWLGALLSIIPWAELSFDLQYQTSYQSEGKCEEQLEPHADLSHCNFEGMQLNNLDLSGADLNHANLIGADLSNTNLSGANLEFSQMDGTNLSNADLQGANLHMAQMTNVKLTNINLTGADLSGANLSGAIFENAIVEKSNFDLIDPREVVGLTPEDILGIDSWKPGRVSEQQNIYDLVCKEEIGLEDMINFESTGADHSLAYARYGMDYEGQEYFKSFWPESWLISDIRTGAYVACLYPYYEIMTCTYMGTKNTIELSQPKLFIELRSWQTGEIIETQEFDGDWVDCPAALYSGASETSLRGKHNYIPGIEWLSDITGFSWP